jgi:hypothetical protein
MDISEADFERWRKGNKFQDPDNLDDLQIFIGWFFDRIRLIVSKENHLLKFRNVDQILEILQKSAKEYRARLIFTWNEEDGFGIYPTWGYLKTAETMEKLTPTYSWDYQMIFTPTQDVLKLPQIQKHFGRIYRHKSHDYGKGKPHQELMEIMGDVQKYG